MEFKPLEHPALYVTHYPLVLYCPSRKIKVIQSNEWVNGKRTSRDRQLPSHTLLDCICQIDHLSCHGGFKAVLPFFLPIEHLPIVYDVIGTDGNAIPRVRWISIARLIV